HSCEWKSLSIAMATTHASSEITSCTNPRTKPTAAPPIRSRNTKTSSAVISAALANSFDHCEPPGTWAISSLMTAQPPLLFIFGGGDEADQVTRSGARTYLKGSTDLGKLLPDTVVRHRLVVTPDFFRRTPKPDLRGYPVIANLITEAEHNAGILRDVETLLRGVPGRIV